ncbi:MAG: hypothetical protein ACRD12_12105, partial [Acidimicrobiales bacterium]
GKTGSTDNNLNAWFVGYTPELSTAVWMGSPGTVQREMSNVGGIRVYGGTYPAMVWGAYMRAAMVGHAPLRFTAPDALITRAPKQLKIEGEVVPAEEKPKPEDDGPTTTHPAAGGPATTTGPNENGGQRPTTSFNFDDPFTTEEDVPRTTRTSRVRPRDLTTLPPP